MAVATNAAVIAFSSSYFQTGYLANIQPEYKLAYQLLFIAIFEHIVYGIKVKMLIIIYHYIIIIIFYVS